MERQPTAGSGAEAKVGEISNELQDGERALSAPPETSPRLRKVRIAREGIPFVAVPAIIALALAVAGWPLMAVAAALAAVACALFFRDPDRSVPGDPDIVVAPADGRVTSVIREGGCLRIAIFLSLFDVHVNRAPVAGRVTSARYTPGRFLAAFDDRAGDVNERQDVVLDTDRGAVEVAQIAGLLARRIVCRVGPGQRLQKGDRFGLIRFGSRTDVSLPEPAVPLVRVGDRVRGGGSAIARFHGAEDDGE